MYVCMYLWCVYVCVYECIYVCVCMHVCAYMYVCMYVYVLYVCSSEGYRLMLGVLSYSTLYFWDNLSLNLSFWIQLILLSSKLWGPADIHPIYIQVLQIYTAASLLQDLVVIRFIH